MIEQDSGMQGKGASGGGKESMWHRAQLAPMQLGWVRWAGALVILGAAAAAATLPFVLLTTGCTTVR